MGSKSHEDPFLDKELQVRNCREREKQPLCGRVPRLGIQSKVINPEPYACKQEK